MTIEEHIAKLECFKKSLEVNRPFGIAVQSIHAERSERIFTDGRNADGASIGSYNDTNPIYVDPAKYPVKAGGKGEFAIASTFNPFDKRKQKTKSLRQEKSRGNKLRYFGSYKEFRAAIGREVGFVDLNLIGDLKSNFENRSRGNPSATKISNNEYHVGLDAENSKKKEGLEKRFGNIFPHTDEEINRFFDYAAEEQKKEFEKC
jgi:hypothetical protein